MVVLLLTEVRLGQVIVDLIHLEDDIIRHSSLREEHIQLAGHAASDRMDRKADSAAVRFQLVDDVGDGILSAGDGGPYPGTITMLFASAMREAKPPTPTSV